MNASGSNHTNQSVAHDCFNQSSASNTSDALLNVNDVIRKVAPPPFLLVGIIGNLLTKSVLLRQGMTNTFTGVSLLVLAVVDNVNILAYFLPDWLGVVAGQDYRSLSNIACQICMFFTYISHIVSPWALLAITVERVVCLVWPFKAKKIFTARSSLCVHALLFAGAIAMSMYAFEVFEVSERALNVFGYACRTFANLDDTDVTTFAMNHVTNGIIFHVPFVLLIAGNSVIVHKLYVRSDFSSQRGDATSTTRYRNLSILVAVLNVVFVFSHFPMSVYALFEGHVLDWVFSGSCTDQFWHRLGVFRLAWTSCHIMALVSPSTNFLLYFCSSASFRKEIRAFLKCEKAGGRKLFQN